MVKFAKTNSAGLKDDRRTRWVNLFIPAWNDTLKEYALNHGFSKTDYEQGNYILPLLGSFDNSVFTSILFSIFYILL